MIWHMGLARAPDGLCSLVGMGELMNLAHCGLAALPKGLATLPVGLGRLRILEELVCRHGCPRLVALDALQMREGLPALLAYLAYACRLG